MEGKPKTPNLYPFYFYVISVVCAEFNKCDIMFFIRFYVYSVKIANTEVPQVNEALAKKTCRLAVRLKTVCSIVQFLVAELVRVEGRVFLNYWSIRKSVR